MMTNSNDTEDNRNTTPKVSNELVQQETAANVTVERGHLKARETTLKAEDEVSLGADAIDNAIGITKP